MDGDKNVNKDTKDTKDSAGEVVFLEEVKAKLIAHWKVILVVFVVAIVLLNTLWGMVDGRVSRAVISETNALRTELASLGSRLSEMETEAVASVDHDAIRADIAAIREAGETFNNKLLTAIEAEEKKFALLEENLARQRAHIETLRGLLERPAQ